MRQVILGVAIFPFLGCPSFAEKRIALAVGNSNYENVARLNNPANDARLMVDTLRTLGLRLSTRPATAEEETIFLGQAADGRESSDDMIIRYLIELDS